MVAKCARLPSAWCCAAGEADASQRENRFVRRHSQRRQRPAEFVF
ncbi:MAG: hypothetical protein ACK559_12320 [bacterium]